MKGQWSLAYALVALAVVAWVAAVINAMEPRYVPIDYPQILYDLKLFSLNATAIYCTTYAAYGLEIYCNGSPLPLSGANRSLLIYRGGLAAVRLSRSWGAINYTLYLAVLNCSKAVAPNGGIAYVMYVVLNSTLDYFPELYVNGTNMEVAQLQGGAYLSPRSLFLVLVSKSPHIEVVDYPVEITLTCIS